MADELLGRLRAGKITARSVESQRRSAFRGAKKVKAALVSVFGEVGKQAFGHVRSELEAQR
jgi:hypothetical protein